MPSMANLGLLRQLEKWRFMLPNGAVDCTLTLSDIGSWLGGAFLASSGDAAPSTATKDQQHLVPTRALNENGGMGTATVSRIFRCPTCRSASISCERGRGKILWTSLQSYTARRLTSCVVLQANYFNHRREVEILSLFIRVQRYRKPHGDLQTSRRDFLEYDERSTQSTRCPLDKAVVHGDPVIL
ncbi:hypothetical protein BCR34DRAFT_592987 [Clohesyomyces aquaticus]|uniref:Uncharacterized protein n=1 Tax=Clohesyomyces aquaticus TaxID=1231657 RepID=A0A1Y1YMR8_9PLEO|nr:hypothetical protein BCR34DRAFT_592987 [Clohesyomyces aquaticus]